jgi:hypothetical protein
MRDIKTRLIEAADYLDYLYEGSKHIPVDLMHDREFRAGLVRPRDNAEVTDVNPVAQFFYGGAAEVFTALGPAALPLLARLLRSEAEAPKIGRTINFNAEVLADHILKEKEKERHG